MYICVCNAIRECELRDAARKCGGDAEEAYAQLGKTFNCGQCMKAADEIVEQECCELVSL